MTGTKIANGLHFLAGGFCVMAFRTMDTGRWGMTIVLAGICLALIVAADHVPQDVR